MRWLKTQALEASTGHSPDLLDHSFLGTKAGSYGSPFKQPHSWVREHFRLAVSQFNNKGFMNRFDRERKKI